MKKHTLYSKGTFLIPQGICSQHMPDVDPIQIVQVYDVKLNDYVLRSKEGFLALMNRDLANQMYEPLDLLEKSVDFQLEIEKHRGRTERVVEWETLQAVLKEKKKVFI